MQDDPSDGSRESRANYSSEFLVFSVVEFEEFPGSHEAIETRRSVIKLKRQDVAFLSVNLFYRTVSLGFVACRTLVSGSPNFVHDVSVST